MWAPVGYLPFPQIEFEIQRVVAAANPLNKVTSTAEHVRREARLSDFAWGDFFDRCPSLSVCSPSGTVLRISSEIGIRVREPLQDGGLSEPWVFLGTHQGIIDSSSVEKRARKARDFLAIHMAGIDPDFAIPETLTEYQWSSLQMAAYATELLHGLSNFDGWAVCCAEEDGPLTLLSAFLEDFAELSFDDWEDMFAEPKAAFADGAREAKVGRPSMLPMVAVAYQQHFPTGRGSQSWKDVQQAIRDEGIECSIDTIRRAISWLATKN